MGNCSSCFKVLPPSETDITNTTLEKDKEEIMDSRGVQTVPSSVANGNKAPPMVGSDNCGSLKRAFYPRIPRPTEQGNKASHSSLLGSREPSESKLNSLFDNYKDSFEDAILAEGIERLCADLQLSPDEFRVLVLAWKLNAEQMCCFSRSEFVSGCREMRVDSLRGIQSRLSELVNELIKDPELFKELYRFTFRFGLDIVSGQRILPVDMAACLWRVVFSIREPAVLSRWLFFLEKHPHVRGVPRDTWNMFLNFCEAVGTDLSSYDDAEAWPSLFDDFVEFENDQANQNISKDRMEYCVIYGEIERKCHIRELRDEDDARKSSVRREPHLRPVLDKTEICESKKILLPRILTCQVHILQTQFAIMPSQDLLNQLGMGDSEWHHSMWWPQHFIKSNKICRKVKRAVTSSKCEKRKTKM